jgi:aryl-alcohol dehydrogenase-like predicted oxidoreductase
VLPAEQRRIGDTAVSDLALGAMNFGSPTAREESIAILDLAFAAGVNVIDTAYVYNAGESERIVGEWIRERGVRDRIFLATKVGMRDGVPGGVDATRRHILASCDASLKRLGVEHIDLYQLHKPDFRTPHEETLAAFDELVRAGKVRHVGCSSHPAWFVMEALGIAERSGYARYVSEQPPYNLLDRRIENELIPLCLRHGLAMLTWSPLGGGILAGRYANAAVPADSRAARKPAVRDRVTPRAIEVAISLQGMAQERGVTASQLALLWVKSQPGVTSPIVGPRTEAQLRDALGVLGKKLPKEDLTPFDDLVPSGAAVADFHNTSGWTKALVLSPAP